MASDKQIVIGFDVYGTLLSTESIAKRLADHFGQEKAQALAATWRKYQLEYTWRLNSMSTVTLTFDPAYAISSFHSSPNQPQEADFVFRLSTDSYISFSDITRRSLKHTLAENSLSLKDTEVEELMKAYDSLSAFPDVGPALDALSSESSIQCFVFSNGTHSMVSNSVYKSPDLGPHSGVFKDVVVAEEVRAFKPAPAVYEHLARKVGKEGKMNEMWLVSSNPFDVVGARSMGMQAAWIDRSGIGWTDGMVEGEAGRPTVICKSLGEVVEAVKKHGAR